MPRCWKCQNIINIKIFPRHLRDHGISNSSIVYCIDGNCKKEPLSKVSSYIRHFKTYHLKTAVPLDPVPGNENQNIHDPTDQPLDISDDFHSQGEDPQEVPLLNEEPNIKAIKEQLDLSLSHLYTKLNIPRKYIQSVVDISDSLASAISSALKPLFLRLASNSNDDDLLREVNEVFDFLEKPFKGIHSEYMRLKTYEEEGTYFAPIPCELIQNLFPHTTASGHSVVPKYLTAQLFPLRKMLKALLEQPGVMKKIIDFRSFIESNTSVLLNFMSGSVWKTTVSAMPGKLVFPLFKYSDDFECGNPLGAAAGIHKITGCYVNMPFIPTEFFSSLESIIVAYLYHSSDRSLVSNAILYQPVIDEFALLCNEGILIKTEAFTGQVYFTLSLLLGDNLGVHQAAGFVESFRAHYPCHICKVRRSTMIFQCEEDASLRRNVQNYEEDLALQNVSETGINEECVWNEIPNFHCAGGNLFVDIMHDVWEGCCKFDLSTILNFFLDHKYFDLEFFNSRIKYFNYGVIDSDNKPPILTSDKGKIRLKMTAAQMITFSKFLGLLIGDLIPENDHIWDIYKSLRKVIDLIMAPGITHDHLELLTVYIREHLELVVKYSPKHALKNKHHHMVHYPFLIERGGPLVYGWSMRNEQEHQRCKAVATSIMSEVDLTQSMAKRLQLFFHSSLKSSKFLNEKFESGLSNIRPLNGEDFYVILKDDLPKDLLEAEFVKWVRIKGTRYRESMIVVTDFEDFLPVFCEIYKIILFSGGVYFVCSKLRVFYFDEHYNGYRVERMPHNFIFLNVSDLIQPFPTVISSNALGDLFVTYKYGL